MQSLSDLCLNKIEDSGADTRELAQVELPTQMWTRHPVYKLSCAYYYEDDNDDNDNMPELTLYKNIEISFTGVYTLKVKINITDSYQRNVNAKNFERFCKQFGLTQYERTFENLEGKLSKDEMKKYVQDKVGRHFDSFMELAEKNVVAYEVVKIIFSDPTSSCINSSFEGKSKLEFAEICVNDCSFLYLLGQISSKINFMRDIVYA
jgi:hypothetical protein